MDLEFELHLAVWKGLRRKSKNRYDSVGKFGLISFILKRGFRKSCSWFLVKKLSDCFYAWLIDKCKIIHTCIYKDPFINRSVFFLLKKRPYSSILKLNFDFWSCSSVERFWPFLSYNNNNNNINNKKNNNIFKYFYFYNNKLIFLFSGAVTSFDFTKYPN